MSGTPQRFPARACRLISPVRTDKILRRSGQNHLDNYHEYRSCRILTTEDGLNRNELILRAPIAEVNSGEMNVNKPLEGVRVVEVAMWAFVPSCGAILSDMGADVIKLEAVGGDPVRGLTTGGIKPGTGGFQFMWEILNRGKRSVSLDLTADGAMEVLDRLLQDADVFLTSLLPPARRKLKIDIDDLMTRYPRLIYAIGNGQGLHGPDAEKGGYDAISFWARASISASVTPGGYPYPLPMPGPGFGDVQSGTALAGGVAAALFRRERTGKASIVDTSLLGAGMWAMQASITATRLV